MRNNKPSADPRSGRDVHFQKQFDESPLFRELHELLKEDWNNLSLNMINEFIAKYWQSLKCSDIAEMYFTFIFTDLKEIKGNSTQFTGFSEFLILRSLLHQLGAAAKPSKDEDDKRYYFESKRFEGLRVQADRKIPVNGGNVQPDITIYDSRSQDIKGVIEVKVCIKGVIEVKVCPQSKNALNLAIKQLDRIHKKHRSAKMLLLIFDAKRKTKKELEVPDFITLSNLRDNGKHICELLKESLLIG